MANNDALENWRKQIDSIDDQLITLIAKRIAVVKKIGDTKAQLQLPSLDANRKEKVIHAWQKKATDLNISTDLIKQIYETLHDHAVTMQIKSKKLSSRT